jgi:polar amino acid transport system substrate-binding protein
MQTNKHWLFLSSILLFTSLPAFAEDIEVTIFVDEAYKPYTFVENGSIKGIYVDVLEQAFSKMAGFKVTMQPVPWKRGKKIMSQGEGLGLTPAYFHGYDWPYLYPYSLPLNSETVNAICTEEVLKEPRPKWPEDYLKLSIGNVAGYDGWGGPKFKDLVEQGQIYYQEVQTAQTLIEVLLKGRLDCIMMESVAFDYNMQQLSELASIDKASNVGIKKGAVITSESSYLGYSEPALKSGKYPYAGDFQKAFDVAIYQMTQSGEIKRIINAYQQQ